MPKPRLLITGGAGLLALSWALMMRRKYEVTLLQNKRHIFLTEVQTEFADIRLSNELETVFNRVCPNVVVHTAGLTSVERCELYPEEAYDVNVVGSRQVAELSRRFNARLIHISTDHLFNGEVPLVDESTPASPLNQYGRTKWLAEQVVLESIPEALVLRTNFFGWGPSYRASFSDFILNALTTGRAVTLFDDVYYTPVLIEKLVNIGHALLEKHATGIFNVVGDERLSKYAFGLKLAQRIGSDAQLITCGSIAQRNELVNRPHDMSLSNKKLIKTLSCHVGCCDQMIDRLLQQESYDYFKEVIQL